MASYAISVTDSVYSSLTSNVWTLLVSLSRTSVTGLLKRLQVGQLEIRTDSGVWKFGDPALIRSKEYNREAIANSATASAGARISPIPAGATPGVEGPSPTTILSSSKGVGTTAPASTSAAYKKTDTIRATNAPQAVLIVKDDAFWVRMFVGADLGFAESYMLGEMETPDLGACFELFIQNRVAISELSVGLVSSVMSWVQGQLNKRYANTRSGSLKNIGAHYDISNAMYAAFLSADMTYSSAVFPTLDADITGPLYRSVMEDSNASVETFINGHSQRSAETGAVRRLHHRGPRIDHPDSASSPAEDELLAADELEDGQLRKLRLHIERANIRRGDHVLEIGTGWGSFSLEAVRLTGCMVDTLTLSIEQKALAEQRIAAAGLSSKIKVHLMDYRDMPASWTGRFDRIVSIEMLEAVGIEFLSTYFACLDRVLKPNNGVVSIQCITIPEVRYKKYIQQTDFIRKWIFPGGVLPSVTAIIDAVEKGTDGRLVLDTAHAIGPHYSRTLREWRIRFEKNFEDFIKPALLMDHDDIRGLAPEEQAKEVEIFRRKWIYYFVYCEVGFTQRTIGNHILSFTREGNVTLPVGCA
ncbi:S-adenosyl-L-methionine-dependent methyltransferase [Tilletiaria anomala UBC 951]|uniref:S-adenosyl-L-methionine-dependent methyltransferase n=1 Tax=Tilletiaria anomala (strain ATCC 24038 / CBS 436.72 / UBC 951) TaxID=1037660 RepID=A0A066VK07_TILAU|nr:S-adenosyl-L-methionine-dependent methyltransferase [Tilletiaria anomala UBC 951]KDN42072.1 S-adenosyl-L-methionine-dependent methyltransferase [Tilletiaria anomala UBC 951]